MTMLGLTLAALALGFVLLYRKGRGPAATGKSGS
jgi:hypothetical protein